MTNGRLRVPSVGNPTDHWTGHGIQNTNRIFLFNPVGEKWLFRKWPFVYDVVPVFSLTCISLQCFSPVVFGQGCLVKSLLPSCLLGVCLHLCDLFSPVLWGFYHSLRSNHGDENHVQLRWGGRNVSLGEIDSSRPKGRWFIRWDFVLWEGVFSKQNEKDHGSFILY